MELLREFKPALLFLAKFLVIYFAGNILYGLYIESYEEAPDAVTHLATAQTAWLLRSATGHDVTYENVLESPKVAMGKDGKTVLLVFEGCNGLNVMIVFIAFLFAFGGPVRWLSLFLPFGIIILHFFNLLRIGLLFHLASNNSPQFYYYHKYFFTATLYLVVFGLWAIWVTRFNAKRDIKATA